MNRFWQTSHQASPSDMAAKSRILFALALAILTSLQTFATNFNHTSHNTNHSQSPDHYNWFQKVGYNIGETWRDSHIYDFYTPVFAWHNRLTYDKEHIGRYNEASFGLGIGATRYDKDRDTHSLYFMVFRDSNYYYQTVFGYLFVKNWHFASPRHFNAGVGWTCLLTQRHEYNYIPLPLILPVGSLGDKRLNFQATYVPGGKNDGNILFGWFKYSF
jgi:palmitoyl transferase